MPDGFRFSVKAPRAVTVFGRVDFVPDLNARVRSLGDRLGPLLVRLADKRERDDDFLDEPARRRIDDDLDVALDLRDPSWDGIEPELERWGAVRVNQLERRRAGFRYLRLRDPPYDDAALAAWAATIRGLLDGRPRRLLLLPPRGRADRPGVRRAAARACERVASAPR